jgi:hypothetical protein
MYFIPFCNLWISEVPPLDQLQVSQGKFSYEKLKNGGILSLIEASGKHVYSCGDYATKKNCYLARKIDNQVEQQATVWWFERKGYLWISERHLMRLMIDGREEISYEKSFGDIASAKSFSYYVTISSLIFILFLTWLNDLYFVKRMER